MKSIIKKFFKFSLKSTHVIMAMCISVLVMSSVSWAADYYVATNGSDGNPGTLASPWKTINKANNTLKAGDTAFIKAGTYKEMIKPANSGLNGSPITYSRYKEDIVKVSNASGFGANLQGKSFITLYGIQFVGNGDYGVAALNSSGVYSNITIQECYFKDSDSWAHMRFERVDYAKVLDCDFDYTCTATSPCGRDCGFPHGDLLYVLDSHYGLFEGNTFNNAAHVCMTVRTDSRGDQTYCIIRNNLFNNRLHHALEIYDKASNNIIESNIITNAGQDASLNYCGSDGDRTMPRSGHSAMHISHGKNNIIRKNLIVNCGKLDLTTWKAGYTPATNNHIYNNTIDRNQWGWQIQGDIASYGNVFKNNIFSNSVSYAIYRIINSTPRNNYFNNNNFYGGSFRFSPESGTISLSNLQSTYSSEWNGNKAANPGYVDAGKSNYNLIETSPMIDAGAFLTKTTSAGTGNNIPVQDAGYFSNGLGVVEGDLIQLEGQTQVLKITAINNNTITVDISSSWKAGLGVSLPFNGGAPDIGMFEGGSIISTPLEAPNTLRIISQ
ncbi:MAG: hypothetical protein C4518_06885 [Desulfobacteraceae bacterium]|nr:MAG: hypothetical protein C4518_06885 [Desulfobacteraceae bacterium]